MSYIRIAIVVVFIAILGSGQILTKETKTPAVSKGVFWSDAASGVEVYLVAKGGQNYRLTVISNKDVKVIYRTSINSTEPVMKELVPVTKTNSVKYYEFEHYFSKMTIWMSLECTVDGKKVPALDRTFYDNIFEIAPSNIYAGPKEQEETITVNGCIREGVECLVLKPFSGNQEYSIVAGSQLQVGAAYRITGSIVEVSICQHGKALNPTKVERLDRQCN
jgi:hypothetical protein